jgi:hypothetical protein
LENHPTPFPKNIAPNPIRVALDVLFPWSGAANSRGRKPYPGVHAGSLALLNGKASGDALKDWCSGRRNAPHWFIGVLKAELREKRATIDEALTALENYRGGRGHGAGLRDWWRDKHNAEIEAARRNRSW